MEIGELDLTPLGYRPGDIGGTRVPILLMQQRLRACVSVAFAPHLHSA